MASIALRQIAKAFGRTPVLRGVSLDIADGEFLTLLGPSGCGKSTLLRILAGLELQDGGSVVIDGRPVDHLPPKARDIAMVFQTYALYPHMSVARNIGLPLRMRRLSVLQRMPLLGPLLPGTRRVDADIAAEVRRTAVTLGLEALLDRRPAQLSGGQRQRVALGRAIVRQPVAFLMDEPLSNLDAKLRVQMRAEIAAMHRRLGTTFVYVTHDQAEAMTMSDRVAVMLDGALLQVAPPRQVYEDPADLRVATAIGSPGINLLQAVGEGGDAARLPDGTRLPAPALPQGAPLTIGLRPEALELAEAGIAGAVQLVEQLGADAYLHLATRGGETLVLRADPDQAARLRPGQAAHVGADWRRALFFAADGQRLRMPARVPADA